MVASDWFRNSIKPALKLGGSAVIGGAGALMSGFSLPFAALSALAGSWLGSEWQKNNHILDKLKMAEDNFQAAYRETQQIIHDQNEITASFSATSGLHQQLACQTRQAEGNLLCIKSTLEECQTVGNTCNVGLAALHGKAQKTMDQMNLFSRNLEQAQQFQDRYQQDFNLFVRQSQRKSANLSVLILMQHRQVQRILNEQEKLQKIVNEQNMSMQQIRSLYQQNHQKQSDFLLHMDQLKEGCEKNLQQQKELESELSSLLESNKDKISFVPTLKIGNSATLSAILRRSSRK